MTFQEVFTSIDNKKKSRLIIYKSSFFFLTNNPHHTPNNPMAATPISEVNPEDWTIVLPFKKHEHGIFTSVRNKYTNAPIKVLLPRCRSPFSLALPMGVTVDGPNVYTKQIGLD